MTAAVARVPTALRALRFGQLIFRCSAKYRRYLEVKEGVMGAGKSMLYSCLLDHRSWFAPSTCHSKPMCVLWETSKSLTDAKLYVGKAEIYQVKKSATPYAGFTYGVTK